MVRLVTTHVVAGGIPDTAQVSSATFVFALNDLTKYWVIPEVPWLNGADHVTVACSKPGEATTFRGGDGTPVATGVTGVLARLGVEVRLVLLAVTVKV